MNIASVLISALFVFASSATAFVTEGFQEVPGFLASEKEGREDPGQPVDWVTDLLPRGNESEPPEGNKTESPPEETPPEEPPAQNETAPEPSVNETEPQEIPEDDNRTLSCDATGNEDFYFFDDGTIYGDAERHWKWYVDDRCMDSYRVDFWFAGPLGTPLYSTEYIKLVLRDGAGDVIVSVEGPTPMYGGLDPSFDYYAEGRLGSAAPGDWTLDMVVEGGFAGFSLTVDIDY